MRASIFSSSSRLSENFLMLLLCWMRDVNMCRFLLWLFQDRDMILLGPWNSGA
jgi:hypothetical protein